MFINAYCKDLLEQLTREKNKNIQVCKEAYAVALMGKYKLVVFVV
jgi:hypothetical protein